MNGEPNGSRPALIDLGVSRIKLDRTAAALGTEELLGQLCEECGELIQAAQKLRRAMKGTTPVTVDDATVSLTEECADVALCIDAIASAGVVDAVGVQFIGGYKCGRWYKRTKGAADATPGRPQRRKQAGEAAGGMTLEEAVNYLTPIVESASLPGYKAALGLALGAMKREMEATK